MRDLHSVLGWCGCWAGAGAGLVRVRLSCVILRRCCYLPPLHLVGWCVHVAYTIWGEVWDEAGPGSRARQQGQAGRGREKVGWAKAALLALVEADDGQWPAWVLCG